MPDAGKEDAYEDADLLRALEGAGRAGTDRRHPSGTSRI